MRTSILLIATLLFSLSACDMAEMPDTATASAELDTTVAGVPDMGIPVDELTCPTLVPPAPDFCKENFRVRPVFDEARECVIGFECVLRNPCPRIAGPGPNFCKAGEKPAPRHDQDGICIVGFTCVATTL